MCKALGFISANSQSRCGGACLGRLRQEDLKFKVILSYTQSLRPALSQNKKGRESRGREGEKGRKKGRKKNKQQFEQDQPKTFVFLRSLLPYSLCPYR